MRVVMNSEYYRGIDIMRFGSCIFASGIYAVVFVATLGFAQATDGAKEVSLKIDDHSFKCMTEMTPVRHFYVDNLAGHLAETVAVAKAGKGQYPVGSVVQLMPNEVMIKHEKGFNAATKDWEFFWIDVDKNGSKIFRRGFIEVNNRFGLNCFACHVKANADSDFICEQDHGCAPIPVTRAMFGALQRTDPRCKGSEHVSADDQAQLKLLAEVVKSLKKDDTSDQKLSEDANKDKAKDAK